MKPEPSIPVFHHSNTPTLLVLFDIDSTLVHTHKAGRRAFSMALKEVFGWEDDLAYISFAGTTDSLVLDEVFRRNNHPPGPEDHQRLFEALPVALDEMLRELGSTALPGTQELLEMLHQDEDVALGLVTGNIEACAHLKLHHAGLGGFFTHGGFADDHHDRTELARLAAERVRRERGNGHPFDRTALIGDSPSDIRAARENGMHAVGVATGIFETEVLYEAGADVVFEDLSDTDAVLRTIGLG